MDIRLFLSKVLMLVYRSREIGMVGYDTLIERAFEVIKINDKEDGFMNGGVNRKLHSYILELLSSKEKINLDNLIVSLEVVLDTDPKLLKIIQRSLSKELDELEVKEVVGSLASEISNFGKFEKSRQLISKLSYEVNHGTVSVSDMFKQIRETMGELTPLTVSSDEDKDPAIVDEIRIGDKNAMKRIVKSARDRMLGVGVYKTGWQRFNKMTQGGLRPGESVGLGAMQHSYKTGTSQTLFTQVITLNKPILREVDKGKKPLAVYLYLEDPIENGINFIYQYLKATEGVKVTETDLLNISEEEISEYVTTNLESMGFEVILLKVNPSEWGIADLFNYFLKLESKGYAICLAFIDYLLMLNLTGCRQGAGLAEQDLLNRACGFFRARQTLFFTPFQLSDAAMALLRNDTPPVKFIREIAGKNYSAKSKSISQEFDLELYCNLIPHNGMTYLGLGRGKHRLPTNVAEEDKFFMLPFRDKDTPCLPDIDGDDTAITKLGRGSSSMGDSFDLMDDL